MDRRSAIGVVIMDVVTKEEINDHATIILLNALTIATTDIILNSVFPFLPNGLGDSSLQLNNFT